MAITFGAPMLSRAVKSRPETSGVPSVEKYCGPTTSHCMRGYPSRPAASPSGCIRFVLLSRPASTPFSETLTALTPGTAAIRSISRRVSSTARSPA